MKRRPHGWGSCSVPIILIFGSNSSTKRSLVCRWRAGNLARFIKGNVNGSWTPLTGTQYVETGYPDHFTGLLQHPPHSAERVGDCIEASGCELFSTAHHPAITLSKAQPQQAHPSARGAVVQGPRTASSGKSPRDPAGDWCNGPCSKGQAPASKGHGPHSKAKGPRPEEQGPRCKIQHSRSAPRSKRPGPMSLAHRPWPRTLGSIPKVKVSSWKRRCQVSCGLGIRTPPHGPRSNLQPRWGS